MKKQVTLVGVGNWGKNHLRNLIEMNALHSISDANADTLQARCREFSGIRTIDFQTALKQKEIRGIIIATPAVKHFEMARQALLAGKDVLVEKPLALTADQGRELVKLAENKKRILMVGHILRYHRAVEKMKAMVNDGELGHIRYIYSNRLNIGKLRTEENVLWSFAPHDISLIMMLMDGEMPERVQAFGGAYLNPDVFDTTLTGLEFRNGVRCHIFVSWLHPFKEQKLVIVGSEKMLVFDDTTPEKLFLYPHRIKWSHGRIPVAEKADCEPVAFAEGQPLRLELEHFVHCINTREKPLTDGSEGVRVLDILEQAELCLRRGVQAGNA